MRSNRPSSPITPHEKLFVYDSSTESDSPSTDEWMGPENQLGLEPGYPFSLERDDQWVVEDVEVPGGIDYHQGAAKH